MINLDDFEVFKVDMGRQVICDSCSKEFTDLPDSGGFMWQTKAICPECAPRWLDNARKFNETRFIGEQCPEGMSFADWVREVIR